MNKKYYSMYHHHHPHPPHPYPHPESSHLSQLMEELGLEWGGARIQHFVVSQQLPVPSIVIKCESLKVKV